MSPPTDQPRIDRIKALYQKYLEATKNEPAAASLVIAHFASELGESAAKVPNEIHALKGMLQNKPMT